MPRFLTAAAIGVALMISALPSSATAQDRTESQLYDPTHMGSKNEAAEIIQRRQRESMSSKGFITPQTIDLSIVHYDYMEPDQFGLLMAVPDVVSGCYKLSPLQYETKFVDPYFLEITVKNYRRTLVDESGGSKQCDRNNQTATALMVLSKKDMMARQTKQLRLSNGSVTDTYDIVLNDDMLELIPRSMMVFRAQNLRGPLEDRMMYSFKGETLVALYVPMAQPGDDIQKQVEDFARVRALSPAYEGDVPAQVGAQKAVWYFYDDDGHIRNKIGEKGYTEIGEIQVSRPYDGPEGRTATSVNLPVFVAKPGIRL